MDEEGKIKLKEKILEEIEAQKNLIENLKETSKPVAPDNAIGRLTRMEAINSKSISDASLNSAKVKLEKVFFIYHVYNDALWLLQWCMHNFVVLDLLQVFVFFIPLNLTYMEALCIHLRRENPSLC